MTQEEKNIEELTATAETIILFANSFSRSHLLLVYLGGNKQLMLDDA
jgi:hypothetical protein